MESDKRGKNRQLQKVNYGTDEIPEGYDSYESYVTKKNTVHEKSRRIKTNDRNVDFKRNSKYNRQHLNLSETDNERYFYPNRETECGPSFIAKHSDVDSKESNQSEKMYQQFSNSQEKQYDNRHTQKRDRVSLSGYSGSYSSNKNNNIYLAKYNISDQYSTYPQNYKDLLESQEKGNKQSYEQANFEFLSSPNNITLQTTEDTALICRAINLHGEPVTVNDKIIKNKVILSCKPRHYPQDVSTTPEVSIGKNQSVEEQITNYEVSSSKSPKNIRDPGSLDHTIESENYHSPIGTSTKQEISEEKHVSLNLSSNRGITKESKSVGTEKEYHVRQQYKEVEHHLFYLRFKRRLWTLFLDSTLLVLVGIILLFTTLYYYIFRDYLSIVIGETGFVTWLKYVTAVAVLIIIVGVVGIITSLIRTKPMLKTYLVLAAILLAVLILFIVVVLEQNSQMKIDAMNGTSKTFSLYRCSRRIRVAWDTMMEVYQCCGKDGKYDWKYIPPACCSATSKSDKLHCIGHFIDKNQAFEEGCKSHIQDYYSLLCLFVMILLLLAIILLLIGIFDTFKLHQMYRSVLLRDEH